MNEQKLPYWVKSMALDTRAVRRTIRTIRMIRGHVSANDLQSEVDSLCFWWQQRRVCQQEIARLKGGVL